MSNNSTTAANVDFSHRRGTNVVLFGETGAGKSTFINYLCNYFGHGNFSNLKVAIPSKFHPQSTESFLHSESNLNDNTQSKTNLCHEYEFVDSNTGKRFFFIDTPGIPDTRGNEQNNINITRIIDTIIQLGHLTALILVVNGSANRLSSNLQSFVSCLHDNLPDKMLTQVIVLLTNVRKYQSAFDLNMLDLHGEVYPIFMQNDAFVCDPKCWGNPVNKDLQISWERSMQQIKSMLSMIDSFQPQSLKIVKVFKQEKHALKAILHEFRLEVTQLSKIHDEFNRSKCNETASENQSLTLIMSNVDSQLNVICTVCNQVCHSNCHWGDTIAIVAERKSSSQTNSTKSICSECKHSCSILNHYQAKQTIEIEEKTIKEFLLVMKRRLNLSTRQLTFENVTNEINDVFYRTIEKRIEEIQSRIKRINWISSSFQFDQEIYSFNNHYLLEATFSTPNDILLNKMFELIDLIKDEQKNLRKQQLPMLVIDREEIMSKESSVDTTHHKTVDLVELYNRGPEREMIIPILSELHRRVAGKSIHPLTDAEEIFSLNQNMEKYKDKDTRQLSVIYRQLQIQINGILGTNILEIVKVPKDLLRENFIVLNLLEKKEKEEKEKGKNFCVAPSPPALCSLHPPFFPPTIESKTGEMIEHRLLGFSGLSAMNPIEPGSLPYPTDSLSPVLVREILPFPTASIPDVIAPINTNQIGFERFNDEFYSMFNVRLVRFYEEAKVLKQREQQQKYHEELVRRCFGQYPRLIDEYQSQFLERIEFHRGKQLDKLRESHRIIIEKIKIHIEEDNVTLINEIPRELIIDAAALYHLIEKAKKSDESTIAKN